ncbi:hypothetical protein CS542_03295 [Pedobacter sp. IW39]|nr:hypothetical protein CS542_03295 [Pedobacter sp. IW39]
MSVTKFPKAIFALLVLSVNTRSSFRYISSFRILASTLRLSKRAFNKKISAAIIRIAIKYTGRCILN